MMTNVKDSVEDLHPRTWLRGKARADGTGDAAVGEDAAKGGATAKRRRRDAREGRRAANR